MVGSIDGVCFDGRSGTRNDVGRVVSGEVTVMLTKTFEMSRVVAAGALLASGCWSPGAALGPNFGRRRWR